MTWCEANGVDDVFGLARNARLVGAIADDLAAADAESLAEHDPARRFADFAWQTRDSWNRERRVVAKAEHLPKGSNPRFVVTSLPARDLDARPLYEDVHCARGEMEILRPRRDGEPDVWAPPALQAVFPRRSGMRGRLQLCIRPRRITVLGPR